MAVNRVSGASQRGGAERRLVQAGAAVAEAPGVARKHFVPRHQVMAEGDGLRDLQMGEAGHDGLRFALGQRDDGGLQAADFAKNAVNGGAGVETDVGRDLVIA